jgi:hypothetical protein
MTPLRLALLATVVWLGSGCGAPPAADPAQEPAQRSDSVDSLASGQDGAPLGKDNGTDKTSAHSTTESSVGPAVGPSSSPSSSATTASTTESSVGPAVGPSSSPSPSTTTASTTESSVGPAVGPSSSPSPSTTTASTTQPAGPPPVGPTYLDFAPYRGRHGGQLSDLEHGVYSQWASLPRGTDRIDISWGSPKNWDCSAGSDGCPSTEEHGIRRGCSVHGDWVWIYAYRNDHINHRYRILTTKAVLIRAGKRYDITGQCGTEGQPYALANDVTQPYELEVWGTILDNTGAPGRRFYWKHQISPPAPVTNRCWPGEGPATRSAVRQDELWWDSATGWVLGGSQMGANGEPNGQGAWYGRYQTMALGTGFAWTLGNRSAASAAYDDASCLSARWDW